MTTTKTAPKTTRSATVTVPDDLAAAIGAATWHTSRTITADQRATLHAVVSRKPVPVGDLVDALVAAAAATSTRWGQSMTRRYGRQPIVETYAWLRATAPDALLTLDRHDPLVRRPTGQRGPSQADLDAALVQIARLESNLAAAQRSGDTARADRDTARADAAAARANLSDALTDIRHLQAEVNALKSRDRGTAADVAAYHYALTLMSSDQRVKVDAFRTGYTVGRGSND